MLYIWPDFYIVEKFFSQRTRNDSSATVPSDFYIRVYISHIHGYVVHIVHTCVAAHDDYAGYLAMILAKHFVKPSMCQFVARIVPQILAVAPWTSARAVAYVYSSDISSGISWNTTLSFTYFICGFCLLWFSRWRPYEFLHPLFLLYNLISEVIEWSYNGKLYNGVIMGSYTMEL